MVTQPPTVSVDSDQHYLYLGMADLATFNVTGSWTDAGVRVGDQNVSRLAHAGRQAGTVFALCLRVEYAARHHSAWSSPKQRRGQRRDQPARLQFPKKEQPKYTVHDLQVSDAFMQKVINELDPNGSGDPVTRFVKINTEMRRANNKTLSDLAPQDR